MEKCCEILVFAIISLTNNISLNGIPFIFLIIVCILRFISFKIKKLILFSEYAVYINFIVCVYIQQSIVSYFILGQLVEKSDLRNLLLTIVGLNSILIYQFNVRNTLLIETIVVILLIIFFIEFRNKKKDYQQSERKQGVEKLYEQHEDLNKSEYRSEHKSEYKSEAKVKLFEQSTYYTQQTIQRELLKTLLPYFPNGVAILNNGKVMKSNQYFKQLFNDTEDDKILELLKQGKNIFNDDGISYTQFCSDMQFKCHKTKKNQIIMSNYDCLGDELDHAFNSAQGITLQSGFQPSMQAIQMITKILCNENKETKQNSQKSSAYTKPPQKYFQLILDIVILKLLDDSQDVLMFVTDISTYNQLHLLKQISHNKSKLLRSVCHETRNPLNCILQSLQILKENVNQQIYDTCIDPISLSCGIILNLVNDLLDMSQINSGKFRLSIEKFSLNQLLNQIQKLTHFTFQAKGLEFQTECNISFISSDEKRIRQILINLVQNALKFTQNGIIKIKVVRENQEQIKFEVSDTGIGIKKEAIQKLFKAFSQIEDNQYLNKDGIGLGLQISNVLCQSLSKPDIDGQKTGLSVESEGQGKGSKFSFTIFDYQVFDNNENKQLSFQQNQQMSIIESENHNFKTCECKEFLFVDDEPYNVKMLLQQLQKYKLKVDTAYNGQEAYEKVLTFPAFEDCGCRNYRIIFMDVDMGVMDGCEATKVIRQQLPMEKIKIIGCSGFGMQQADICKAAGMDAYLEKPLNAIQILKLIQEIKSEM